MKKFIPIVFFSSLFILISFLLPQYDLNSNNSGAGAGYSGAPGENNCRNCHNSFLINTGGAIANITTNIPAAGYIGGQTYTITATITQTGINKFGFEISAENSSNNNIGSWIITNSSQTKIVGTNYVTHTASGTAGTTTKSWSMNWKAPCAGQGNLTFYCAYVAANSSNSNSGDYVYTRSLVLNENVINSADTTYNLSMADVGNNFDGRDLKITFKTSLCETRTQEYRAIAVKLIKAPFFNIDSAKVLTSSRYVSINTGTPITKTKNFGVSGKDADGDPIHNNEPYKIFILSKAKTSLVSNDTLLISSGSITLTSSIVGVSSILATAAGGSGNASDLKVEFTTPSNEKTIGEYRSIVVKSSNAGSFSLSDANSLLSSLFKTVPTGNPNTNVTVQYQPGDKDADGDTLAPNIPYRIFIITKADGINSILDTIQISDTDVVISEPITGIKNTFSKGFVIIQQNGYLSISSINQQLENVDYEIISILGKIVQSGKVTYYPFLIDLSQIEEKIGILRLRKKDESISKLFVH